MKLFDCVELVQNNYECVILKVKEGKEFDLICLGCFNGDETMFRLTKGGNHTCTVWKKDGKSFSWDWGDGGYTLVSDKTKKTGDLIQNCIEQDFDIYIGKNVARRSEQVKKSHTIKCIYRGGYSSGNICVHKDDEYYRDFASVDLVRNHFEELGFKWTPADNYIAQTGCCVECYIVKKVS